MLMFIALSSHYEFIFPTNLIAMKKEVFLNLEFYSWQIVI